MAKTFKRIAALAMAIALVVCFAVSASAISVATTTQYVAGDESKVNVTVNVTDGGDAAYVTYYATKDSTPVFIDQEALDGGNATIQYQTAATNLKGSVIVGYTDGAATNWSINGYTVSAGAYTVTPSVIPNDKDTTATVKIAYTASENKKFEKVEPTNATVTSATEAADGTITVVLANVTGDVTLTVKEQAATAPDAKVTYIDGAAIKVGEDNLGEDPANTAVKGNRKLTVIGQFTGNAKEYGVAISSTEAITKANIAAAEKYAALGKNTNGVFAVQLIDEGEDVVGAVIQSGVNYYAAIYAELENGDYVITASDVITVE